LNQNYFVEILGYILSFVGNNLQLAAFPCAIIRLSSALRHVIEKLRLTADHAPSSN
jgi:hypothetical protein